MPPRVKKVKPDKEALKTPIEIPLCNIKEGTVWYPPDDFVIYAHDIMIKRYGYWSGFELGMEPYHQIVKQAEDAEGIYRKAAIILKGIATTRIFQDGHHRTAFEVVKAFLELNDGDFKEKDEQNIIKFIKDIRKYSIEQIESWLKNGTM